MSSKSFTLTMGFLAAFCFAILPGCENPSSTTVSETAEGDHDHDHAEGDHDHADGHDHDDHDHDDHDHDGHDHDGHDHDGHDHDGHDDDHAHDDHSHDFKSIGEATAEIESLRDTIRDEFAAGDADAAHEPLHHIGTVLIAAEEMVKKMDDSPKKTSAAAALDSLLDDFTAIDEGMHGDGGKKYDEVSKSIDAAIATLKKDSE